MPTATIGIGRTYTDISAWEAAQGALSGVHYGELYEGPFRWTRGRASLEGSGTTTVDLSTVVTQEYTFTPNRLYLLQVSGANIDGAPDVTGVTGPSGTTFTEVAGIQHSSDDHSLHLFRCVPTAAASGTLSIAFDSTSDSTAWQMVDLRDVPLTNNGADAIVQSDADEVTAAQTIDANLSAFAQVCNGWMLFTTVEAFDATITGDGTYIDDDTIGSPGQTIQTRVGQGSNTTPATSWTVDGNQRATCIGVEIANNGGPFKTNVDIAGQTGASSSNYMHLRPAAGYEHGGDLDAGVQVTSQDRGDYTTSDHVFDIQTAYTRFSELNVNRWIGESGEAFRVAATHARVEQTLMWGAENINADGIFYNVLADSNAKLFISNCFFMHLGRTSIHVQATTADGTIYVYDCNGLFLVEASQNSDGDTATTGYVGMGDDMTNGPSTYGINWQVKNTYMHTTVDPRGASSTPRCFGKVSASTWLNCNNNGSHDTSVPGTSAQSGATYSAQFTQLDTEATVGYNDADDYLDWPGGTGWQDSYLNSGATTANYGNSTTIDWGDSSPTERPIYRVGFASVPDTSRIKGVRLEAEKSTTGTNNRSYAIFRVLRDWVESEVTQLIYSTGNSWTSAGADGAGDIETYDCDGGIISALGRSCGHENNATYGVAQNERYIMGGGDLVNWTQEAIDGIAPDPDGGENLSVLYVFDAGGSADSTRTAEGSDTDRPLYRIWFDTAAAPVDPTPIDTGVLDGNGANLYSDSDYPVTVDITGSTRPSAGAWDIGPYMAGEEHLAAASVTGVIDPITATWIREIERTASGALALDTNTPVPYLGIERTASVDLAATVVSPDPYLTIARSASVDLRSIQGSDIYKSRDALSDFTDNESTWTDQGSGVYRCTSIGTGGNTLLWNHFIPMDREIVGLEWGMQARLISGTAPNVYLGFREHVNNDPYFGAGIVSINPQFVNIFTSTETTLTADININDTTCTVASAAGWENSTNYFALMYNIENDQSDVPNKNTLFMNRAASPISGNVITFHDPSPVFVASGTKVRQSRSGGTDQYVTFPSGYLTGSFQGVYNWMSQPFEDIQAYSTTWAADGDNKMFCSASGGGGRSDGGYRPGTDLFNFRIFTIGNDATTIVEVRWIYIKTLWESTALVDHSASGTLPVAITTVGAAGLDIERAELVSLEMDASAGEAGPVQYLRPISDVTVTNFEDEGAGTTDIFNSIDEATRSDSDYIVSNSGAGGTYEGALTSSGDPESSEMHILKVVAESDGVVDQDAVFSIVEGTTVIASWTVETIPAGLAEYTFRMTPEQNDNITDYTDLRWRVVVEPSREMLTYFPGDAGGTFTRAGTAWEWRP